MVQMVARTMRRQSRERHITGGNRSRSRREAYRPQYGRTGRSVSVPHLTVLVPPRRLGSTVRVWAMLGIHS